MPATFILFELMVYLTAALLLGHCWRQHRLIFWVAILGMIYSATIEFADMYFDKAYYYGDFLVMLGPAPYALPLQVAVAWGEIIALVMLLTARLPLSWPLLALVDAFLAVSIDLTLDPVVSRGIVMDSVFVDCAGASGPQAGYGLGFWVWCVNPGERHFWQGVPLENFMGWFVLVATFSFGIRLACRRHGLEAARGLRLAGLLAAVGIITAVLAEAVIYGILQLEYLGVSSWITTGALLVAGAAALIAAGRRRIAPRPTPLVFALPLFDMIFCWALILLGGLGAINAGFVAGIAMTTLIMFAAMGWVWLPRESATHR